MCCYSTGRAKWVCAVSSPSFRFAPTTRSPSLQWLITLFNCRVVDSGRVALYGISFGGYLAARAAAADSRISALILNPPMLDFGSWFRPANEDLYHLPPDLTAEMVDEAGSVSPWIKQQFRSALARFGVTTLGDFLDALPAYHMGSLVSQIRCPLLGMVSQGEGREAMEQAREFAASVFGPSTLRVFTPAEGADSHCQFSNLPLSNEVVYDWLAGIFA